MLNDEIMKEAIRQAEHHWKLLHDAPEMAFEEYKTTEYIRDITSIYPVEIIELGMETGLVCFLDAGRDDTVALRADIDAVPTEEGPLHLCGHDGHTATLLGAMHYLCRMKAENPESLTHNVLFIFQPAEEGTRGARALLSHGLMDKTEEIAQKPIRIFGIHNRPEVDCGDVVVHKGPLMSEKSVFTIKYIGKPGHGSLPHKCVDPIVAVGSFITGMQTIISRNIDPFQPAICTLNSVTAGTQASSAPESATMTGYIRSFDSDTHVRMEERLKVLAENTALAYECKCKVDIDRVVPAVNNSQEMYEIARKAISDAIGEEHVVDSNPSLASEDFAVYGKRIPSFLYWVGSGVPGCENAAWHDPKFRMDSHYMETAVPVMCASALAE